MKFFSKPGKLARVGIALGCIMLASCDDSGNNVAPIADGSGNGSGNSGGSTGGSSGGGGFPPPPPPPTTVSIGGTLSGLTGSGLVLQDNGGDSLAVGSDGTFVFATPVKVGAPYAVTVSTQPGAPAQSCLVSSGTGTAPPTNVTNVKVVCRPIGQFAFTANSQDGTVSGFKINPVSGVLTAIPGNPVAVGSGPSSVTLTPNGKFAYVAFALGKQIAGFTVDSTSGALTPIAGSPFNVPFVTGQIYPSAAVDPSSHFLYMTSMGDNAVAGFVIDPTTGVLTSMGAPFPAGPKSSGLPAFSPDGAFLYVTNQTAVGSVSGYSINKTTGVLTPVPGSPFGARNRPTWISFVPAGNFAYVANTSSNNISAYAVNTTTGALTEIAGSPFSDGQLNPQDLTIDATGTHLYVPNLHSNTASVYAIANGTGALTPVSGSPFATGRNPGLVAIDPTGRFAYIASQSGFDMYGYSVDPTTGALAALPGSGIYATGADPVFATVDPSGKFVYTANEFSANISGFAIDATSGVLTPVTGSPFAAGMMPFQVSISPEAPGVRD